MDTLTDGLGTIELDEHTTEAASVITRRLGETQFLTFNDVDAANHDGRLTDVLNDLDTVLGGTDMAWAINSILEEGPR